MKIKTLEDVLDVSIIVTEFSITEICEAFNIPIPDTERDLKFLINILQHTYGEEADWAFNSFPIKTGRNPIPNDNGLLACRRKQVIPMEHIREIIGKI